MVLRYSDFLRENVSNFDIDIYEHGNCEVFALALHRELGYKVFFYMDDEAEFEGDDEDYTDTALVHAYAVDDDGNMFDASGQIDEEMLDDHADYVVSPRTEEVTEVDYRKKVKSGLIAPIVESEVDECRQYIRNNISKYKR